MEIESREGLLREILENLRSPEKLDSHPWVESLFVQEFLSRNPVEAQAAPGYRLARAVGEVFSQHMPGVQPKRGKRLDTQWGSFGILAAQYFSPFLFGVPYPSSLRDAWGRIDESILFFRFGKEPAVPISDREKEAYKLVGDERDVTPVSTISDWHRKGIADLAEAIQDREKYLAQLPPGGSTSPGMSTGPQKAGRRVRKWVLLTIAILIVAVGAFAGFKGWRIYQLGMELRTDLNQARKLAAATLDEKTIREAGPLLEKINTEVVRLHAETYPTLRILGPLLWWVPGYGAELADSPDILDAARKLSFASLTAYQAALPIYESYQATPGSLDTKKLTSMLAASQPQFELARQDMVSAQEKLADLEVDKYSPRTLGYLDQLDGPLGLLDTSLTLAVAAPRVLGASSDGPKTYLVLIQNEDELRPTGGFITSVATVVVKDGGLFGLEFQDTDNLVNWALPYPNAPWQLRDYMNSAVLVFRDANWFPNYPTTVSWAEFLYAYNNQHSVDGVFAIDQQFLVGLLEVTGPLEINDLSETVNAQNVISYMREAKKPPIQPQPKDWTRKSFIPQIGNALLKKLESDAGSLDLKKMLAMVQRSLEQRHLLLQFDDPGLTRILAQKGWDGAVTPGDGDFLMVVDSNIGFNKANAAVEARLVYEVDLKDPAKPSASLTAAHSNQTEPTRSCIQFGGHLDEESRYPIYYCYYNYLRVYLPEGSSLLDYRAQRIPADWMILKKSVDAQVDVLEEEIPGVQGLGTLVVVPGAQTIDTSFNYSLPAKVLKCDSGNTCTYSLKIQKQPGTKAIPLTLIIHLPDGAKVVSSSHKPGETGSAIEFQTDLRRDLNFQLVYSLSQNPD